MAVLLASAPHADTFGYSMPPPGLLRLGGALRDCGHAVALSDLAFDLAAKEIDGGDQLASQAAERLLAVEDVDVIGLSTMGATLPIALAIAARLRTARPRVTLLLGGPGTTGIDAALIERFAFIDGVVRGEAERTLPELLTRLGAGHGPAGVRGVTWRDAGGEVVREADRPAIEDLSELPEYAWDLLAPIATYKAVTGEQEGLVPIDSGRGCVFDCSFCTIGRYWGRRSRTLPVPRLVEEVAALKSIPGARCAYLCHDLFAADRKHAVALCEALIAQDLGVPWEVRARVDHLDDQLIELMGRAGCYRVLLGIESGDAQVRNDHAKRMDPDFDVLHVVRRLASADITPILSLILGLPGEDEAALERTLDLALRASLVAGCNLSFHLVNPQPGCGLGESHGRDSRPVEGIPPDMALGAGESAEERALIAEHPDLFSTFALLTGEPGGVDHLRRLHRIAGALPDALMTWPRTFALLMRSADLDVGGLTWAWLDSGQDFPTFAAERGDALIEDMLAWEQAVARAPQRAEVVRARFDLPAVTRELGEISLPLEHSPTCLAVVRGERGVRTLRVSKDLARLCETPAESLDQDSLAFLEERGLTPASST